MSASRLRPGAVHLHKNQVVWPPQTHTPAAAQSCGPGPPPLQPPVQRSLRRCRQTLRAAAPPAGCGAGWAPPHSRTASCCHRYRRRCCCCWLRPCRRGTARLHRATSTRETSGYGGVGMALDAPEHCQLLHVLARVVSPRPAQAQGSCKKPVCSPSCLSPPSQHNTACTSELPAPHDTGILPKHPVTPVMTRTPLHMFLPTP